MVNTQIEKILFNYIIRTKKYYSVVEPEYFNNEHIRLVYKTLQAYYQKSKDNRAMSNKQMWDLVKLNDKNDLITLDTFKNILRFNIEEYNEKDFIIPTFETWVLDNKIKYGSIDIIERIRSSEGITDLDEKKDMLLGMRGIMEEMFTTKYIEDDDLGSDFDDPESHNQDLSSNKIPSGISCLDNMLNGGWDVKTLNVLMAETNNGKSLWMQNLAVNAANLGKNVLYVTLEMPEKKIMKRIGAMRLKIPINDYDKLSEDSEYIARKIQKVKDDASSGGVFEVKHGKIFSKFWAAGTSSVEDIDLYLRKIKEKKDMEFDLLIVDYITLLSPNKKTNSETLYTKGKVLAEGLRALADKYSLPVVTGIQVGKDAWNSSDITLQSVPESKAIAETADTFFAIIRTEEMKKINLYKLKLLKHRDGDFQNPLFSIDLNVKYLTLENDRFL